MAAPILTITIKNHSQLSCGFSASPFGSDKEAAGTTLPLTIVSCVSVERRDSDDIGLSEIGGSVGVITDSSTGSGVDVGAGTTVGSGVGFGAVGSGLAVGFGFDDAVGFGVDVGVGSDAADR